MNHQQSVQIQAQKQLLAEKHKELFELDAQIDQYTDELRQKRSRNNFINHKNKSNAADSNTSAPATSSSFRSRSGTSGKLETLLEVEEEVSDGHASSKSSTEDLTEGPGPPRVSRVTALKSRFEGNAVENRGEHRRVADRLLNSKTNFTEDNFTPGKILNNSPQRVDPEGVETPESSSPERPGYDDNKKKLLSNFRAGAKPYDQDSKTKRDNRQQISTVATHSLDTKHISSEPDFQSETPSLNSGRTTPSDEGDNSGLSSPSSLSSTSSASSNPASRKAAMFALTGVVKKAEKSTDAHGLVKYENANLDGRASPLQDFQGPQKAKNLESLQAETEGRREGLDARGAFGSELFSLHQVKTEGLPTGNENVDSIVWPTLLDFSRAGTKFKHDGKKGKSRDVPRSNHGDNSDDGCRGNDVKEPSSEHVTPMKDTAKTGKIQLSRLRYQNVSAGKLNQDIIGVSQTVLKGDDEDQSAKEHRKTESLLNGNRKKTYLNTNASRLSQDASGKIGSIQTEEEEVISGQTKEKREFVVKDLAQKKELGASTSRLPQSVSVPSFIRKTEVVTLSGPGSSNVIVPFRHTKKGAVFSMENKMRKPEQNIPPSRLPAKCVVQTGEEVIFSSNESSESMIATSGESKLKAQFSSKNNLLKDEQKTSSPRLPHNSVSANSPIPTGKVLSSSSLPSVDLTTPIEEPREKIELTVQDNMEKTEINASESKVLFYSPSVDNFIPNGEEVVSSASSTPSKEKDETDNAKVPEKDNHVTPSFGQSQLVPLTLKPISYRAKKLSAEQQGDLASANQSHLVPVMSNSVSVRGQSSLTRVTATPSATFFSSTATDIPEKLSPLPTSKRPKFMKRDTGPSYPEIEESLMSNYPGEEISQVNNSEKEIATSNGWIENDKSDLCSEETRKTRHRQKPRNLAGSNDVKQVVSSFNIRLSSRSRKAAETKENAARSQENSESIAKSSGLLVTASTVVGPRKMNSSSGCLGSENDRVSVENEGPFSRNGGLNSESDRPRLVTENLNSGSGKSLKIEAYSRTVLNKNTDKVKAGQVSLVQNQATDENNASNVQKEKSALEISFILGEKSNGVEPVEGILVDSNSEKGGTREEALTKKYSPGKAADDAEANGLGGRDAVAYLRQAIKSVSDQLPSDGLLKPAVLNKDTGLAPISRSSYSPISDQPPDKNPSVSKTTEDTAPRYEVFSKESESVRESPEVSQGNVQKADRKKKARHVSLDPHAVLLDAAVEGELELVKQIVGEVRKLLCVKIGCEVTEET